MEARPHLLNTCIWDTTFDDALKAEQLQDLLSQWSHTRLEAEMESVLSDLCPLGETWRFDSIEIDLGRLTFSRLNTELGESFRLNFRRALSRLIQMQSRSSFVASVTDKHGAMSALEFLRIFLQTGRLPWWIQGRSSHTKVLESLIKDSPQALATLLLDVGQQPTVRQRMVLQWQEENLKQIVTILEPSHAEQIIEFSEHLVTLQQSDSLGMASDSSFSTHRWYWVLTHLLVERGSLFNTTHYVRSTILQMAQHYNLTYEFLLASIVEAFQQTDKGQRHRPVLFQALHMIATELKASVHQYQDQDYWTLLKHAIRNKNTKLTIAGQMIHINVFIHALLRHDKRQVAQIVNSYVQGIPFLCQTLADAELKMLLAALRPSAATLLYPLVEFVMPTAVQKTQRQVIWQVLLMTIVNGNHVAIEKLLDDILKTEPLIQQRAKWIISILTHATVKDKRLVYSLLSACQTTQANLTQDSKTVYKSLFYSVFEQKGASNLSNTAGVERHLASVLLNHPNMLTMLVDNRPREMSADTVAEAIMLLVGPADFTRLLQGINARAVSFYNEMMTLLDRSQSHMPVRPEIDFSYILRFAILSHVMTGRGRYDAKACLVKLIPHISAANGVDHAWVIRFAKFIAEDHICHNVSINQWSSEVLLAHGADEATPRHTSIASITTLTWEQIISLKRLTDFVTHYLCHGYLPICLKTSNVTIGQVLERWMQDTTVFKGAMLKLITHQKALYRFIAYGSLASVLDAMVLEHGHLQSELFELAKLQQSCRDLKLPNIHERLIESWFLEAVLKQWLLVGWQPGDLKKIMQQISIQIYQTTSATDDEVTKALSAICLQLGLEASLFVLNKLTLADETVSDTETAETDLTKDNTVAAPSVASVSSHTHKTELPIHINNAGLVLLSSFIQTYFERMGILAEGEFHFKESQHTAVHLLQFLVTGKSSTEEQYLVLNKLLCGLSLTDPTLAGVALNEKQEGIATSLLEALIGYWDDIQGSSIDGFRGNWLVRDGTMIEREDHWSLVIEKRSYDVLLERVPFSFSVINYSWMNKPIYVTWWKA